MMFFSLLTTIPHSWNSRGGRGVTREIELRIDSEKPYGLTKAPWVRIQIKDKVHYEGCHKVDRLID